MYSALQLNTYVCICLILIFIIPYIFAMYWDHIHHCTFFYLFYVHELFCLHKSVHYMPCLVPSEARGGHWDCTTWNWRCGWVVSCHVDVRNLTQVLAKVIHALKLLSHLSSPNTWLLLFF